MALTSFYFIFFLIIVMGLYYVLPKRFQWIVLLLASISFYASAGLNYLPFVLGTACVSYFSAGLMGKRYRDFQTKTREEQQKDKKFCKRVVSFSIVFVLGALIYCKFAGYFIRILYEIFVTGDSGFSIQILFPLGISYYTFSTIGYLLDVYWRRYSEEKNFWHYLLYVLYFPHILQGPIPRYNRLAPQLTEEHNFDYKRVTFGIQLMIWGYFQKLVIADRLGIFVRDVYGNWKYQSGAMLLIATVFASFQMYTDFSGCMSIVCGISEIFGIKLEKNFRQPYFSKSIEEFWRRWHITLGSWFKDYLCMPVAVAGFTKKLSKSVRKSLGIQAGKNVTVIVPLVFVWTATGLWHGTGLNYILWGGWHGGIIIISTLLSGKYLEWKRFFRINETSNYWKAFCMIRTFFLTAIIPRVITQSANLYDAVAIFKKIFFSFQIWELFDGSIYNHGLNRKNFDLVLFALLLLFCTSFAKERNVSIREWIAKQPLMIRWMLYYAGIFSIILFGIYGIGYDASSFAYINF